MIALSLNYFSSNLSAYSSNSTSLLLKPSNTLNALEKPYAKQRRVHGYHNKEINPPLRLM